MHFTPLCREKDARLWKKGGARSQEVLQRNMHFDKTWTLRILKGASPASRSAAAQAGLSLKTDGNGERMSRTADNIHIPLQTEVTK
jgi:hypothetical protein